MSDRFYIYKQEDKTSNMAAGTYVSLAGQVGHVSGHACSRTCLVSGFMFIPLFPPHEPLSPSSSAPHWKPSVSGGFQGRQQVGPFLLLPDPASPPVHHSAVSQTSISVSTVCERCLVSPGVLWPRWRRSDGTTCPR